jgi:predicted Rdx family selenoprotein
MTLRRFVIERDIPKVGTFERQELRDAAAKSNEVLHQLGPDIQWVESYVADNKTFCVYLARDENIIHEHARISGFPATKITEVRKLIDPTTAAA